MTAAMMMLKALGHICSNSRSAKAEHGRANKGKQGKFGRSDELAHY